MSTIGVRAVLLCAFISTGAPAAHGQQTGPPFGALDHTVWTVREGAPSGVHALAQSGDGTLWIGAATGLYQFDGVRFEAFEPPASRPQPPLSVSALLALADGTLWIGYTRGGASVLANGQLVRYSERQGLPEGTVTAFARDSTGDIWAATTSGLARFRAGRWQRIGLDSGYPGGMTSDLLVDHRGSVWAPTMAGVFVMLRGASRFVHQAPSLDPSGSGGGGVREAPDGSVWGVSPTLGLTRLSDSTGTPTAVESAAEGLRRAWGLLIDHHGTAWVVDEAGVSISTPGSAPMSDRGRRPLPVTRVPTVSGGLTTALLQDREGNIWVGAGGGLDRFRETKLTPVVFPEPIARPALAAGDGGTIWVGTASKPAFTIGERVTSPPRAPTDISCAYRDLHGGVWLGGPGGLWYRPPAASALGTAFVKVALPPEAVAGDIQAIAQSLDGDLWISFRGDETKGVVRRRAGVWSRFPAPAGLSEQMASTVVTDSAGRTWLGYAGNRLVLATHDSSRIYSDADGIDVGDVRAIFVRGSHVWIGGESGIMLFDGTRFRLIDTIVRARGITGIVETVNGDLWLSGAGGITHVIAAEVGRALQNPDYRARAERFDYRDGLNGEPPQTRPFPTIIQGTDGRLWFATADGVAWLDPARITRNTLPPRVQIRSVTADRRRFDHRTRVALPARTTELQISYTAVSLARPDRVRFRYRLVGLDTAWREAGTRREATYTNLRPGSYRFQVIAANEDDVWNDAGAGVDVDIPARFIQTKAFLGVVAVAIVSVLLLLAQWRQRHSARALRAQFEATLAERARVARELHDTLLGKVTGVAMQLNAGARRASATSGNAAIVELLTTLSSQVQRAVVEARRSVTAMHTPPDELAPLHEQLANAATRTFAETGITAHVDHMGEPRQYPPTVASEIVGIATEAMANARQHAGCQTVTITCSYAPRELRVRLHDDGRAFDPAKGTPIGHWGLVGMRERAASIGGQVSLTSSPAAGTEVILIVPGGPGRWTWWTRAVPSPRA